jgi:HSP20 family protein
MWETRLPALLSDTAFESFNRQIDNLFNEAVRSVNTWTSRREPECNVYEDADGFYIQVALPGMDPNHIEVQAEGDTLVVRGERKMAVPEGRTWHTREVSEGPFACSFRLPAYVDHGKSTASYKQGILTIAFPKHEEAKPRRIAIEAQ